MKRSQAIRIVETRQGVGDANPIGKNHKVSFRNLQLSSGPKDGQIYAFLEDYIPADEIEKEFKKLRAELSVPVINALQSSVEETRAAMEKALSELPHRLITNILNRGDVVDLVAEKVKQDIDKKISDISTRNEKIIQEEVEKRAQLEETIVGQKSEIEQLKKQMAEVIKKLSK
ncbi:MAG: hypothetical protein P1V18_04650 [Candidatus Gracilibacteria bacterium]|nr:hypothetical protein [Candidatus Gracilibacteria bacterium]